MARRRTATTAESRRAQATLAAATRELSRAVDRQASEGIVELLTTKVMSARVVWEIEAYIASLQRLPVRPSGMSTDQLARASNALSAHTG